MGPMKDSSSTWMYPVGVDRSALEVAKRERKASGICSMKALMEGWDFTEGQTAAYMATTRARETAQATSSLPWSRSVFSRTLASTVPHRSGRAFRWAGRSAAVRPLHPVIAQERLLQRGLGTFEILHLPGADPFQQGVQGRLRGVAAQGPAVHQHVPYPGDAGELRHGYVAGESGTHPVQGAGGQVLQP